MTVFERFVQGDVRALSRIISHIENRTEGYRDVLGRLYERSGTALRIGVTGPPGAGKSSLVNCLTRLFLTHGKRVGIIAVDPSSPFTGGALLGDRVRMGEFPPDGSVYFRSMATRGATGGLAQATSNAAVALDAFGFDTILIETVGVGQVELDVIDTCDSIVVAVVPESGDAVQAMKAGLMEIADIFVVNKADRPGSEKLAADLRHMLQTRKQTAGMWKIPIIPTQAVSGQNVDLLFDKIHEHVDHITRSGMFEAHRRDQIRTKVLAILKNRFQRDFIDGLGSDVDFADIIERVYRRQENPYQISDRLYDRFRLSVEAQSSGS